MSLRIIAPSASDQTVVLAKKSSTNVDHYMERLVKLVPVESISAYPLLATLAGDQGLWAEILVSWLLLSLSVVLRWHATATEQRGTQWFAVAIACISFIIWVNVMKGHFGLTTLLAYIGYQQFADFLAGAKEFLAVVALIIWTILVPIFYKGDAA